jgi:tetratricopeptide (TPR) repeat protein
VQRYYQALALRQLGKTDQADTILRELVSSGASALNQPAADVGPGRGRGGAQTPGARNASAHYLAGLGYSGLGQKDKAREEFTAALATAPDLLGAKLALAQL